MRASSFLILNSAFLIDSAASLRSYRNIIKSRRAYVITLIILIMFPCQRLRAIFMRHSPVFLITFLIIFVTVPCRRQTRVFIGHMPPAPPITLSPYHLSGASHA
jgi:hypothetical protein